MKKKYKLTDETININGIILYRIEALRDFSIVKKGDKGGFVLSEMNLSHKGDCWIYNDAMVYDDARVYGNAKVYGQALVYNNAKVYDNAIVYDNANVFDNVKIYNSARVHGNSFIFDKAEIYGYARVCGNAEISGYAQVYGNAEVYDNVEIFDGAKVCGDTKICGKTIIGCDAKIENNSDYITFKNWWSSGRYFTWTRSNNKWSVGCFYGNGKELIEKAYKDSELSGREYERIVNYVESILKGR